MIKTSGVTKQGKCTSNVLDKKHHSQMDYDEIVKLVDIFNSIKTNDMNIGNHLLNKLENELCIDIDHLYKLIYYEELIEFNNGKDGNDCRILIRHNDIIKAKLNGVVKDCNLCFVYSLKTNDFITAYLNCANDHHKTLDLNEYSNLDIKKILNNNNICVLNQSA